MWFRYNPQIIFYHFFFKLNLVIFQALLLSTYVDSMYLVRVAPLMNFRFSDDSLFLKKNLGGGHKFSEFACLDKEGHSTSNAEEEGPYDDLDMCLKS